MVQEIEIFKVAEYITIGGASKHFQNTRQRTAGKYNVVRLLTSVLTKAIVDVCTRTANLRK